MFNVQQKPLRFDQTVEGRQLRTYLTRLARGETNVLPEFRTWLKQNQHICSAGTNLARQAEQAALALFAGPDPVCQQIMSGRLAELKLDLGGPEPSPLEQLLIDRIALDWILLHLLDNAALPNSSGGPIPLSGSFLEKSYGQVYRRYLKSIKSLAQVGRLLRRRNVRKDILQAMGAAPRDPLKGSAPLPRSQPAVGGPPIDPLRGIAPLPPSAPTRVEPPVDRFRAMGMAEAPPWVEPAANGSHAPMNAAQCPASAATER